MLSTLGFEKLWIQNEICKKYIFANVLYMYPGLQTLRIFSF